MSVSHFDVSLFLIISNTKMTKQLSYVLKMRDVFKFYDFAVNEP